MERLFGDPTIIKDMDLSLGEVVCFLFRNVHPYSAVVVDNDSGNRITTLDSENAMLEIFHHMAWSQCGQIAIQSLPYSHCDSTWALFETGCNTDNRGDVAITIHLGDLRHLLQQPFVNQFPRRDVIDNSENTLVGLTRLRDNPTMGQLGPRPSSIILSV